MRLFPLSLLLSLVAVAADAGIVISSVTPNSGPTSGGTEVRIEGSGFFGTCTGGPCEERSLFFADRPAWSLLIQSDNLVIATTPAVPTVTYWLPVLATLRVGTAVGVFTFYYSDVVQTPSLEEFERVLLPAYNCYLQGAHGSEWCATLAAFNGGQESAVIHPIYPADDGTVIAALALPPSRIFDLSLLRSIAGSFTETAPLSARVIYVDREHSGDVHFNLRLFDLSRTSTTWGTNVPIVRERDLFQETIQIFPVPLADRFRTSLRIYDPSRDQAAAVAVRFFSTDNDRLVASRVLNLYVLTRDINSTEQDLSYPGIAEILNLTAGIPELAKLNSESGLRIEIEPLTPGLRFWAMASVTNDETQHVTLLTPSSTPR